jgi:hypothetical protein
MWHTLPEAIKLTGRSRRSLYRDMNAGHVSYRVREDTRREIETSEMIRAYGPLVGVAQSVAQSVAQVGTPSPDVLQTLLDEIQALREEVRELKQLTLRIEHRPALSVKPA